MENSDETTINNMARSIEELSVKVRNHHIVESILIITGKVTHDEMGRLRVMAAELNVAVTMQIKEDMSE